jgi:hypothetical protein
VSFKGSRLALLSFGIETTDDNDTSMLKAQAAFLGAKGELHGYTDLMADTRQLPVALRLKLSEARDAIEAHIRSLHFEGTEDGNDNDNPPKPSGASPGGIAEHFQRDEDSESFEQGGG